MMRNTRHLTQAELAGSIAEKCDASYSVPQISRYENGTCRAPFEYIIDCCTTCTYHPLTFMMCFLKNDYRWWQASLTLNSGMYFDDILTGNFERYGDRLLRLTPNDMGLAANMVRTILDNKLSEYLSVDVENEALLPQKTLPQ